MDARRSDAQDYELAKMGVDPTMQRRGIGLLLGQEVVRRAKGLGARSLFVESNTVLGPAIALYERLGFAASEGFESPYERCNYQAVMRFS